MTDSEIRLSDAEREAAAADLGEHFAQGRLTADEHAERLEQVWAAKTRGEIAPIFRDLPSPYAAVAAPTPSYEPRYWNVGLRPATPRRSPSPPLRSSDEQRRGDPGKGLFCRGVPAPLLVVLALLIIFSAIAHFPLFLLGIAIFLVVLKHRGHWGHRRWR